MDIEVVELVRPGRTANLDGVRPHSDWAIEVDFDQPQDNLIELCGYPCTVLHLAWSHLNDYSSELHLNVELPRHLRFLTHLLSTGLQNLLVTGTCFEYGLTEGSLSESYAAKPITRYATAKVKLHEDLLSACEYFGANLLWLRLFYFYGPGQADWTLWGQFQAALARDSVAFPMSPGDQKRDYLHVDQVADRIARLVTVPIEGCGITNVCSGKPIRLHELVRSWIAESGKQIDIKLGAFPYAEHEPLHAWGDATRLESLLRASSSR